MINLCLFIHLFISFIEVERDYIFIQILQNALNATYQASLKHGLTVHTIEQTQLFPHSIQSLTFSFYAPRVLHYLHCVKPPLNELFLFEKSPAKDSSQYHCSCNQIKFKV